MLDSNHYLSAKAQITAIGAYAPEKVLSNGDIAKMVDTNDEWILSRVGIKNRHISAPDEYPSDMAIKAIENLKANSGKSLKDVDYVIVATFTSGFLTPSTAAIVQAKLGIQDRSGVLDINAACAGFVQGLFVANSFITSGLANKIIVVGVEALSKITDYTDRNTCILFGDAACAFLIEKNDRIGSFISYHYGSSGIHRNKIYCSGLADKMEGEKLNSHRYLWMDGRAVYRFAVQTVPAGMKELVKKANMEIDEIDWFIPHSANLRIIENICQRLNFPMEKTLTSLEEYGNTSSASIPMAIWLANEDNKLKSGDKMALYGFGGGLNHAGLLMQWV
jgi:3-oxoacyl-[acyl-carrier-protein] synthase-3